MTRSINTTDAAKLIRACLKRAQAAAERKPGFTFEIKTTSYEDIPF